MASHKPPLGKFISVSAGGFHSCGIRDTGSVDCWGDNQESVSLNASRGQVRLGQCWVPIYLRHP